MVSPTVGGETGPPRSRSARSILRHTQTGTDVIGGIPRNALGRRGPRRFDGRISQRRSRSSRSGFSTDKRFAVGIDRAAPKTENDKAITMDVVFAILEISLWILAGLLGLILFLINMPYALRIVAARDAERTYAHAYLGWPLRLAGLEADVSFENQSYRFVLFGFTLKSGALGALRSAGKSRRKKKKKKEKKQPRSLAQTLHGLRTPHGAHLLRRLGRWIFLNASLSGRVGFSDPSLTGQLAVILVVVRSVVPGFAEQVVIDFENPEIEGRAKLSLTIWLPRITSGALIYLLSPQGRAMVRHYFDRPRPAKATT